MTITRELLRDWHACWDDEDIARVVPPDGLTPLQACDLTSVSVDDRLWVLLRDEVIPARQLRLLACLWAERALSLVPSPDPRSGAAIAVARRYAAGEATAEDLAAAWAAAWAAARAAQISDVRRVLSGGEP